MSTITTSPLSKIQELRRLLRERYDSRSVWKELLQNADDANAHQLHFAWMSPLDKSHPLFNLPALCVLNDGIFTSRDAAKIIEMGDGTKGADEKSIGRFGLGLKSIFNLCDTFFFLASPNQEAATNGNYFFDTCNPWAETSINKHWCTEEVPYRTHAQDLIVNRINNWSHGLERWFALWIPLRVKDGRYSDKPETPLIEIYPQKENLFPHELTPQTFNAFPLLKSLESLSIWDEQDFSHPTCKFKLGKNITRRTGEEKVLLGDITYGSSKEEYTFHYVGKETNQSNLNRLKNNPNWPAALVIDRETGREVNQKQKAIPHAAVIWGAVPTSEKPQLTIYQSVYLPLPDPEKISIPKSQYAYYLNLHGYYFLDSGRREIYRKDDIEGEWNKRLEYECILPLVMPTFANFAEKRSLSFDEIAILVKGLTRSQLWKEKKNEICKEYQWVAKVTGSTSKWKLIEKDTPYYELPEKGKDGIDLFEIFPRLTEVCDKSTFVRVQHPKLTAAGPNPLTEDLLNEILQDIDIIDIFQNKEKLYFLTKFLREYKHLIQDTPRLSNTLQSILRQTLQLSYQQDIKSQKEAWLLLSEMLPDHHKENLLNGFLQSLQSTGIIDIFQDKKKLHSFTAFLRNYDSLIRSSPILYDILRSILWRALEHFDWQDFKTQKESWRDLLKILPSSQWFALPNELRDKNVFNELLQLNLRRMLVPAVIAPSDSYGEYDSSDAERILTAIEGKIGRDYQSLSLDIFKRWGLNNYNSIPSQWRDLRVFLINRWYGGEQKTEVVSWKELDDLRLYLWSGYGTEDIVKCWTDAIDDVNLCLLSEKISKVLFSNPVRPFDKQACFTLLSRFRELPCLRGIEHRKALLQELTIGANPFDGKSKLALRYLLHGDQNYAECGDQKLLAANTNSRKNTTVRSILSRANLSWIIIPKELTDLLTGNLKRELNIEDLPDRIEGIYKTLPELDGKPWLPQRESSENISPRDIIYLPEIEKELEDITKGYPYYSPLVIDIESSGTTWEDLKCLLPERDVSLQYLADIIQEDEKYFLGGIDVHTIDEIKMLPRAFGNSSDILPILPILRKLIEVGTEDGLIIDFVNRLNKPFQESQRVMSCLQNLAGANRNSEKARVYQWYFQALIEHPHFSVDQIRELTLPNKSYRWRTTEELCFGDYISGLNESHHLEDFYADKLKGRTNHTLQNSEEHQTTEVNNDSQVSQIDRERVDKLRQYFKPWKSPLEVPNECIGLFLAFLGRNREIENLAQEYLGRKNVDQIRAQVILDSSEKTNDDLEMDKNFRNKFGSGAWDDCEISILSQTAEFRIVKNIFDDEIRVSLPQDRWISTELSQTDDHRNVFVNVSFRKFLPSDDVQENKRFLDNIQEALREIIKYYNFPLNQFDSIWDELANIEQEDLSATQSMVLEDAFSYFKQLSSREIKDHLGDILDDWDEQRYSTYAEKGRTGRISNDLQEKSQDIFDELRSKVLHDRGAAKATLTAIRQKIEQAQYEKSSVPFELFQNADDAIVEFRQAYHETEFPIEMAGQIIISQEENYFRLIHWGRPINKPQVGTLSLEDGQNKGYHLDLKRMITLQASGKYTDDTSTTGKFGLGFKSTFLVSDRPRVLSDRLGFEIRGGFYPSSLGEDIAGRLRNLLEQYQGKGTIIELPLTENESCYWMSRFEKLLPILLALSNEIKSCELNFERYNWHEKPIVRHSISLGQLQRTPAARELPDCVIVLRLKNLPKSTILLGINADGFTKFPSYVPDFWVTTPTRQRETHGVIIDGDWEINTGRAQLTEDSRNEIYAKSIGKSFTKLLQELFDFSWENWESFRKTLQLSNQLSFYDFWKSFLTVVDKELSQNLLLNFIFWGEDGALERLFKTRKAFPNGLPADKNLVQFNTEKLLISSRLDQPEIFQEVRQWGSFQAHYELRQLISKSTFDLLPRHFRDSIQVRELTLLDVLKTDAEASQYVTPECADRYSQVINADMSIAPDGQKLQEYLYSLQFMGRDGSLHHPQYLLMKPDEENSKEESLCAGFAPDKALLSSEYGIDGICFFRLCRPQIRIDAKVLAQWGRIAETEEKQRAFLTYISQGQFSREIGEFIIDDKPEWITDLQNNTAYQSFAKKEQAIISATLGFYADNFQDSEETEKDDIDNKEEMAKRTKSTLERIYDWWEQNRGVELLKHEHEMFPFPQFYNDLKNPQSSNHYKSWITFLLRGSLEFIWDGNDERHANFIIECEKQGLFDGALELMSTVDDDEKQEISAEICRILENYLSPEYGIEYLQQIRQGSPFLLFSDSINIKEYISIFSNPQLSYRDILSRDTELRSLFGIGVHWILRELASQGIIQNPSIYPHCFHPRWQLRKFMESLGCEVRGRDRDDQSQQIYTFIYNHIGKKVTFHNDFDIALLRSRE